MLDARDLYNENQQETIILAVDDDPINLEAIEHILTEESYIVKSFSDGNSAIEYMAQNPHEIHLALLDKMMPEMDGFEILKFMKSSEKLLDIPVIMQTAAVGVDDMVEGVNAGAYYYLTKPYNDDVLLSVVRAAERDYKASHQLQINLDKHREAFKLVTAMSFEFSDYWEAPLLATVISSYYPNPKRVIVGLLELLLNAVEHGNLCISYEEKTRLTSEGALNDEINRRMGLEKYKDRKVVVDIKNYEDSIVTTIVDDGAGFDWKKFMDFDPLRSTDPNGRGIAMANTILNNSVSYNDSGNKVEFTVPVEQKS